MPWETALAKARRAGRDGERHRRRGGIRRLRPGDTGRHQPAQRPAHSRTVREQVGLALQRPRRVRALHSAGVQERVFLDAGRSGPRREVECVRRRADDQHARGDRPRVGPGGRAPPRQPAGVPEGAVLGARRITRRPGRPLLHRRREAGRAGTDTGREPRRDHPGRVRGLRAERARATAPRARGVADRRRPHAQPPDDRALAHRQHGGGGRSKTGRTNVLRNDRRPANSVPGSARCSPRFSGSSQPATTTQPDRCSTPTGSTSIRLCATRWSRASSTSICRPTPASSCRACGPCATTRVRSSTWRSATPSTSPRRCSSTRRHTVSGTSALEAPRR